MSLTHLLGQEIHILLVSTFRSVEQLDQGKSLRAEEHVGWRGQTAASRDRKSEALDMQTWVVAVMDSTNVGTVEQLRLRRRP